MNAADHAKAAEDLLAAGLTNAAAAQAHALTALALVGCINAGITVTPPPPPPNPYGKS